MKNKFLLLLSVLALALSITACNSQKQSTEKSTSVEQVEQKEPVELYVSAAASLKDALEEINASYEAESGNKIVLNLAGSGKLAQQILEGAPADIFISASNAKMQELVEKEAVEENEVSILLKNELVMIVPKDAKEPQNIQQLTGIEGKIAIGEVETVPAGTYAKEALTNMGVWDDIQDKIVYAKDVRAVLSYVEQAEVEAGFVYASDAVIAQNSQVQQTVDENAHKAIVYPMAVLKDSNNIEEAKKYQDYLKTDESTAIFKKFGFKTELE